MTASTSPGSEADGGCTCFAAEIARWETAALCLPLPEVVDMADGSLTDLAECLNTFNGIYACGADGPACEVCGTPLEHAMSEIIRQACAAAILALGARQRTRELAEAN
jgi:hypothetical protein